jgi:hypothetical protein
MPLNKAGANPLIVSYNVSSSLVRFEYNFLKILIWKCYNFAKFGLKIAIYNPNSAIYPQNKNLYKFFDFKSLKKYNIGPRFTGKAGGMPDWVHQHETERLQALETAGAVYT